MKNYPHLYPSALGKKPINTLTRSPTKNSSLTRATVSSKATKKTTETIRNTLNRDRMPNLRNLTKSIQEQRYPIEQGKSQEKIFQRTSLPQQDDGLFSRSYCKIDQIKLAYPYKHIDQQLNEVLTLLKEQKNKISEKLKLLKQANDNYKIICEEKVIKKEECGVNTEEMLGCRREIITIDKGVDCIKIEDPDDLMDEEYKQCEISTSSNQSDSYQAQQLHNKISKMLAEMGLNSHQIIPQPTKLYQLLEIEDMNCFSDRDIIRINKLLIRQLIIKLTN